MEKSNRGMSSGIDILYKALGGIRRGSLQFEQQDGKTLTFGSGDPLARVVVKDQRFFDLVPLKGDIGFGEAYMQGYWDSPNLAQLLTLLANNRSQIAKVFYGHKLRLIFYRLRQLLRTNFRPQVKRNIKAHYDLGNDFFKQWLDPNMNYSSAVFGDNQADLTAAQINKHQLILDKIAAQSKDNILDIGCGWGAFLAAAQERSFTNLHGITISNQQLAYSKQRLPNANIRFLDYRDIKDVYDKIVSIEMFEAVGEKWWKTYFQRIFSQLRSGGRALIQTIVIDHKIFPQYKASADFIRQYVFPGGMLASSEILLDILKQLQFKVVDQFYFGADYAKTLAIWHEKFDSKLDALTNLGFDQNFQRLWKYYLASCEASFASKSTDVCHFLIQKP